MNCLICQEKLEELGKSRGKKIYKCPNCGFGQTEGLEKQKDKYHRDETYIAEETLFKNIFQKRVNKILSFKKIGSALEIGCSTGLMLSLLKKKGWDVMGVEISKKAAEKAKERGIKVISESIEEFDIKGNFDLVILNHTLEHLKDPVKTLEKVSRLLSEEGLLFVDVPNFGGFSARTFKENWSLLLPGEHLWHFTENSLSILLTKLGFKIVFIEKSSGIWNMENPLLEVLTSFVSLKKRFIEETITAIPSWIISKLGIGSDLMVIAKR